MTAKEILQQLTEIAARPTSTDRDTIETAIRHITEPTVETFVVFTSAGNWGKAPTLLEAMKNAHCLKRHRATAYACSADVTIYESGRITASCLVSLGVIQKGATR